MSFCAGLEGIHIVLLAVVSMKGDASALTWITGKKQEDDRQIDR